jgi:predicted ribosome quality control (RQC) complex YloA/Tae2 family protein
LQGNVILTDANYEVLTLLRSHRDDDKGLVIMARHAYPIHSIRLRTPLEKSQLDAALASADEKQTLKGTPPAPYSASTL